MVKFRIETDTIGSINVDDSKYWGAQTQRSLKYFHIGHETMPHIIIKSLAIVKKCAAQVNKDLKLIEGDKADIIDKVATSIINGELQDQFPLSIWQTGSGTQTHMNINEVISNKAIELLGGEKGSKHPIHPNDDVNKSQSSNDVFPTAMNIAVVLATQSDLLPMLHKLQQTLENKVIEFKDIIKIGRTHMQDATPLTLGQEFSGYAEQIARSIKYIEQNLDSIHNLAQGATAVGTGINTHPEFSERFANKVAEHTSMPFKSATNKFAALASHDDLVNFSGSLNTLAVALNKIANDIRWLSCGPRAGIAELIIPANEPGSSIMPGKTNPTQIEAITMVCCQVMGNHSAVSIGGMSGNLELNVYKPLIIYNILNSISLLSDVINSFNNYCLCDVKANNDRIEDLMKKSLMLVTALNKHIGYDKASQLSKYAYHNNISLEEANNQLGIISSEDFKKFVDPKKMIQP